MKKINWSLLLIIFLSYMTVPMLAQAVIITVNSTVDEVDATAGDGNCLTASSTCSLRAAIQEANALEGDDSITLPAGTYTLSLVGNDGIAASGDLDINSNITITGAGMTSTVIDGNATVVKADIFSVSSSGTLNLSAMKLTNSKGTYGTIYSYSGNVTLSSVEISGNSKVGIYSSGSSNLTITDSIISDNSTSSSGPGGIFFDASGSLLISNSTISNNSTTGSRIGSNGGGGLAYYATGSSSSLVISNSTFSGNNAGDLNGGALSLFSNVVGATAKIYNTTVSGNSSNNYGGGIIAETSNGDLNLMIYSSTITSNMSSYGGGIYISSNSTNLSEIKNSIFANNIATIGGNDCYGIIGTSGGYNFIGDQVGCTITLATGDQAGDSSSTGVIDPSLGVLQNNGGNTETHAVTSSSLVHNAGDPAGCTDSDGISLDYDQRGSGYLRINGSACDIGAYELQAFCSDGTVDSGETCDDSNTTDGDGCSSTCIIEFCGDNVVNNRGTETCDDGNTIRHDGCNSTCQIEYPPFANAGKDQSVTWPLTSRSIIVTVDGSASTDRNGPSLVYAWTVVSVPRGSTITTASLTAPTMPRTSFSPDLRGSYTLHLKVQDPDGYKSTDDVIITVR